MSDQTTNLMLPFVMPAQAQKHVPVNEAMLRLDAVTQLAVVSASVSAQPASPSDGAVYILPAGKTGADWDGMTNWSLGYYRDGAWEQITPREGWIAYARDSAQCLVFTGADWTRIAPTYEEGTFTPTMTFATPGNLSVSYSVQNGVYTRIGRLVIFDIALIFTPTFSTASGNMHLSLPFNAASDLSSAINVRNLSSSFTWPAGRTMASGLIDAAGAARLRLRSIGSAVGVGDFGVANVTSGVAHTIAAGGTYHAA
jgi:hypothetical protein